MAEPTQIIAAAENGEAWAQNWMGAQSWVAKDWATAAEWFRKAAMQGDRNAQLALGGCYYDGHGVEKNPTEAQKWYEKAADQGQDDAQLTLGFISDQKDDFKSAYYWYRRSAEQGNDTAQNNLACLFFAGKGIPTKFVEAYKWLNLAAAQGYKGALAGLELMAKKMTREQIAEGQRRAEGFVAKKETIPDTDQPPKAQAPNSFSEGDMTNVIERLEAFEEHLRVRLEALQAIAFIGSGNNVPYVRVCGEIHASDGVTLKQHIKVVVDAYDSTGKLLSTGWLNVSEPEKFYGFETFMIQINVIGKVGKVRVYPKLM